MALLKTNMLTRLPHLSTWLGAVGASNADIFTLTRPVTWLPTFVCPTLQLAPTRQTASRLVEPAWLILEYLLPADARLLHQERTLRTGRVLGMTLMRDCRMSTRLRFGALKPALWWLRPTRLWGVEYGAATRAGNLIKDGLKTRRTRSFVAELLACVLTTLQSSTADLEADVLCFKVVAIGRAALLLATFSCLFLARAAVFSALVTTAVELCAANAEAKWLLDIALMAGRGG